MKIRYILSYFLIFVSTLGFGQISHIEISGTSGLAFELNKLGPKPSLSAGLDLNIRTNRSIGLSKVLNTFNLGFYKLRSMRTSETLLDPAIYPSEPDQIWSLDESISLSLVSLGLGKSWNINRIHFQTNLQANHVFRRELKAWDVKTDESSIFIEDKGNRIRDPRISIGFKIETGYHLTERLNVKAIYLRNLPFNKQADLFKKRNYSYLGIGLGYAIKKQTNTSSY